MNGKDLKRKIAFEVLAILGMLALLTYICRLWPILLLIILGIFMAAIRLLFLSSKQVTVAEPLPLLSEPRVCTEKDVWAMAYSVILKRITELVTAEYPNARWVWELPNAKQLIEQGDPVFVLLNHAGGYRRAKVKISNLQVIGLEYQSMPNCNDLDSEHNNDTEEDLSAYEENVCREENYELLAFEWVETTLLKLNAQCNEAIGSGLDEFVIPADELPARESWAEICRELKRNDLHDVWCVPEGIKINLKQ